MGVVSVVYKSEVALGEVLRGGSICKLLKVVLVSPYTSSKRSVNEASFVAALSTL